MGSFLEEAVSDILFRNLSVFEEAGFPLTADMTALLGCSVEDIRGVLTALGYRRIQAGPDPEKAEGERWDRRKRKPGGAKPRSAAPRPVEPAAPVTDSPFAALAELKLAKTPPPQRPRKARAKKAKR